MKHPSIIHAIGNTPLVRLRRVGQEIPEVRSSKGNLPKVEIYAKVEFMNPGGSVKDRAALRMVQEAIKKGELTPDKTILDSTSGNTGVAYAMIGAALGYQVELVMPPTVSPQRKKLIEVCGARVTYSSQFEGSDGAIRLARKLLKESPGKYFFPDQYNNPMNPQAHYDTTGVEIWKETEGKVTHFIAGIGTSGTLMGCGRRLKDYNKKVKVIAVEPDDALHGLEGLKHMATAIVPGIYHEEEIDEKILMPTEPAYPMCERLAKEEGLIVGHSSGAAMVAALQVAEKIKEGLIVVLFPDHGNRYFTE